MAGTPCETPERRAEIALLWVGWNEYQTTTEKFEMWVDEVAVDGQRIGCFD